MILPGAVPQRTCNTCHEFLPHACAAVITIEQRRRRGSIRRVTFVSIIDREPS